MWFFDYWIWPDEPHLQNKIKLIVSNYNNVWYNTLRYGWIHIEYDKLIIHLQTYWDWYDTLFWENYVSFNWNHIFNNSKDEKFLLELCKIVYKKEQIKKKILEELKIKRNKEEEEEKKLNRQLLISDALASLMGVELQKVSKEVKDELAPIFSDVTRVQEITSELNTIRRRYSAGWI